VLVNLFTPLPAAVLGMRLGPAWGAAAIGLTATAVLATFGVSTSLLFVLQFGLPAMLLPWLLTRQVAWDRALTVTLGLMLAFGLLTLTVFAVSSGESPFDLVGTLVDKEISQTVTLMEGFSTGTEQTPAEAEAFRQAVASMGELIRRIYPGMLVAVGGFLQLATVGLLALLLRPRVLPGPAFACWRAPELLIWVLISAGFAALLGVDTVQTVALNLLVVLLPVYFLQGLAVAEYHFSRKGLSPLWRGLSYLLLLVVNPLPVIVTGVGIFDLWADFRKKRINNE
jgi:uncharacterized protein YybS (DUF2232 family)